MVLIRGGFNLIHLMQRIQPTDALGSNPCHYQVYDNFRFRPLTRDSIFPFKYRGDYAVLFINTQ